ncbi:Sensor histidine kinase glucose-6-phosphate specific, putative [Babesia ovata]|uniref:Sensor histidine kinase glucose-6-phosphate specific, putative n=1 Tax=Babesia ovata TaxID=189622 RepID=A0A2H6KHQ0_9APIC|nr:Sensor histidine kinase glucose-6-phosphate specific, putative [Babesia ovata]GBE62513.1 Sensor histidine kinase glucose-6-phosphate specific, putative [Babesia ovata]
MLRPKSGERRVGLLGLGRRLARSPSQRAPVVSISSQPTSQQVRSVLCRRLLHKPESSRATVVAERLLAAASERRRELLHSFDNFLRSTLPGYKFGEHGVLDVKHSDILFEQHTAELSETFGAGNVARFHAHSAGSSDGSVIFRGKIADRKVSVLINSTKFKAITACLM